MNRTDETLFGKTRVALTLCLWGRVILRQDIINNVEDSFIGDVRQLCKKYDNPNVTLLPLTPGYRHSFP